jgi:hypothetical protein
MSRRELADAVNAYLASRYAQVTCADARYIGKLERGVHRWPNWLYREAFRAVLGVPTNEALGFRIAHPARERRAVPATRR